MYRLLSLLLIILLPLHAAAASNASLRKINHIVVVYLENHSFDNIFGTFPGADGLANIVYPQVGPDNKVYTKLPTPLIHGRRDPRFPEFMPNSPFLMTRYAEYDKRIDDPVHRFYQTQMQINGGQMDRFIQHTNVGGLVMGYYEQKEWPLWQYAKKYTLADRFFTAAFGGSLLNHFWLVCACTPYYPKAPMGMRAMVDEKGRLVKDGEFTPEGYLVNNIQPFSNPYDANKAPDPIMRLPALTAPTIGDRLTENGISWAWYSGGWDAALKGNFRSGFIPHHHPFIYFKKYGDNTEARKNHLKDENDLLRAIADGTLPAVSFYKPADRYDLHPGYSAMAESEMHVFSVIRAIELSPQWKDTLVIVTFDDSGGFYDHVAPPKRDRFGPGVRVPTLIISPHAKEGFIDHTTYDTTSILRLIEQRFDLEPLNDSYRRAGDLRNALK